MIVIEKFVKRVITASPTESLATIARLMKEHNVGAVVLTERHQPVGLLTDRDLALRFGVDNLPGRTPARDVMTVPVHTVHRDEGIFSVAESMKDYKVRRLVVVDDDDCVVGIVTVDDLLRVLSRELANLVEGIQSEMEVK